MKVVQVFCDGSMDEIEVSSDSLGNSLTATSKSQGEGEIRFLYSWSYNGSTIECYGWFDGEAGFENKHELPPSGHSTFLEESSCQLLFGDLFLQGYVHELGGILLVYHILKQPYMKTERDIHD